MRSVMFGAVAGAVIAVSSSMAFAETVTLDRQVAGDTFGGFGAVDVTFSVDDPDIGENSVRAGGFRLTDGVNNFIAWCASLADNLQLPASFTTTDTPFTNRGLLSADVRTRIQSLFDQSYTLALTEDRIESAAFQLALWNVLYDDNSSVDDGTFTYIDGSDTVRDRANSFLQSLELGPDGSVPQQWILTFWEADPVMNSEPVPGSQNLITAAPIPLPAAAWMLLGALAAVAGIARVRRRTA